MRNRALAIATALALALAPATLGARPGGGSSFRSSSSYGGGSRSYSGSSSRSYSGGSSYSAPSFGGGSYGGSSSYGTSTSYGGSSSSGDDGGIVGTLCVLLFIAFIIFVVVTAVKNSNTRSKFNEWDTAYAQTASTARPSRPRHSPRSELEKLRATDPNFSVVIFEDFVYALFAQVHVARGAQLLERFSPYLAPAARQTLAAMGSVTGVRDVVVGAMRYVEVHGTGPDAPATTVALEFESNYTELDAHGRAQSFYSAERWTLIRRAGARSRTPETAQILNCPNCGAPLDQAVGGACGYCRQQVDTGAFDWVVQSLAVMHRETRGPMLEGTTQEEGTDLPTVLDAALAQRLYELQTKDPQFAQDAFARRVALIFQTFQASWSNRDLAGMRPFMSDGLFQTQAYWIETYKRQGLRNVTEGAAIQGLEFARVSSDAFYDAITVRVHASSLDYTVRDDGRMVGGDRSRPRRYTEYWTLLRGANRRGPTQTSPVCPNCGAPLKINMAGHCEYCRAKVTTGAFDWVLSRIEQDEVYAG